MSQAISAEIEASEIVDAPASSSDESPGAVPRTALDCLSKVAAHHGIDLPAERLQHTYALDGSPIALSLLLRMAKDAGLRARSLRIEWGALFRMGEAYPLLARLTNGNWIVVLGAGNTPDGS